jgi:hypothetical protein
MIERSQAQIQGFAGTIKYTQTGRFAYLPDTRYYDASALCSSEHAITL